MGFALPPSYLNVTKYAGDQISSVPCVNFPRAPRSTDVNYPILTFWRNNDPNAALPDAFGDLWYLRKFVASPGSYLADWVKLGTGVSTSTVVTLSDTSGDKADPDGTGNIAILGGTSPITTDVGTNSVSVYVQTSSAIAVSDPSKVGLAAFSSTNFNVDPDGFVTIKSSASITWQQISTNQDLVAGNGYFCVAPGGSLLLTLPATSTIGDTIEITLDGSNSFEIKQPNAGSQIRYGNQETTLGVGGSISSNAQGDYVRLVCQTTNARWNCFSSSVLTVS